MHAPAVIALQEVHQATTEQMNRTLRSSHRWYIRTKQNIYHSVALGIATELSSELIDLNSDLPIIAARITWPFPLSVASLYLPNGKMTDLKKKIDEVLQQIPEPRLILGDVNSHHRAWGSRTSNLRGSILVNTANKHGLSILNDGSNTFGRVNRRSKENIIESAIDVRHSSFHIDN